MNILLITHFSPPTHNAGTENYTLSLAKAFSGKGHKVNVLCAEEWNTGKDYWNGVTTDIYQGVTIHRIHLNWTKASNPNKVLYDSQKVEEWSISFLENLLPDVVHITSASSLGVGVIRSAKRCGAKVILSLMDFWFLCGRTNLLRGDGQLCDGITTSSECQECMLTRSNIYRRTKSAVPESLRISLWRYISKSSFISRLPGARGIALDMKERKKVMVEALELPDRIISHSHFVKDIFHKANLSQRIIHLPNGQDLSYLNTYNGKTDTKSIRFGYIGQISYIKGIHLLIDAFKKIDTHEKTKLEIWGDLNQNEDYVGMLREKVKGIGSIRLLGPFKRENLASVLAEIDILVVPSIWYENAPLVIYEAFATHTPVITTNIGGMAEAVAPEVNGLLFERKNISDLSAQMRRILDEPDLIGRLKSGISPVKKIEDEILELERIYLNL